MKKILVSAALAASILAPAVANAQAIPGAVIAVVDLDKVTSDCTACKTAGASLKAQAQALQTREQQLGAPLKTEAAALQKSVDALNGKEPDAALKARVTAFQTKQQAAQAEMQQKQQALQNNQRYIQQQIATKLGPIYSQVMQKRGANLMLEVGSTLATAQSVDVTADVTAALNAALPTISTTAPAQPAAQSR